MSLYVFTLYEKKGLWWYVSPNVSLLNQYFSNFSIIYTVLYLINQNGSRISYMWLKSHLLYIKYFIHRVAKRRYHIIDHYRYTTGGNPCTPRVSIPLGQRPLSITPYDVLLRFHSNIRQRRIRHKENSKNVCHSQFSK